MENKLNLVEILKDCPQGMELDCTMFEGLEFDGITDNLTLPIRCRLKHPDGGYNIYNFTKYGCWNTISSAKCVIFPKGKTSWEGFVPPRREFKKESEDERMWKLIKKYVHYNISDMALNADHLTREQLESWLEKQGEQNPYSGVSFKYSGHTFGMCARDGGAEILMDGNLKAFISLDKSFVYPINPIPLLDSKNFQISTVDGLIHDNPTDKIELKEK